jgi:Raf kinase inhibitor-like YbhB/YbcL family protein
MAYRILAVEWGFSILVFRCFASRVDQSGFKAGHWKQLLTAILIVLFFVASEIGEAAMTLSLKSPAFSHLGEIPKRYTCEGSDVSPPLAWSGVPDGTESLALVVDDPDAPDPKAPKMTWVHWVLYNLPSTAGALPEAVAPETLPPGTIEGLNDWNKPGYGGPCPPIGRHRYFHKLYALDTVLTGLESPTKAQLLKAMEGHVLAQAELVGTYQKAGR